MRLSSRPWLLLWIAVLPALAVTLAVTARAQDAPSAAAIERALVTDGLFRALDVHFEPGRSTLLPAALPTLEALAEVLILHPTLRLEIAGHTDGTGSETANLRLSEERARAVKAFLMGRFFIDPRRLETVGYGETLPVASDASPTGRALNRRVEFRVLDAGSLAAPAPTQAAPVDADSLREALRRQVEAAVRDALGPPPDTASAQADELEQRLAERLAELESRLAAPPARSAQRPATRRAGLLGVMPFAGAYLRGDVPVVLGLRADIATPSLGAARLQPEVAFGFRPDDRATSIGVDLVLPIRVGTTAPFVGLGVGVHNLDRAETVLNLIAGVEHRFGFGVLFGAFTSQDLFDYNRVVVGFRQGF